MRTPKPLTALVALLATIALLFGLTACSHGTTDPAQSTGTSKSASAASQAPVASHAPVAGQAPAAPGSAGQGAGDGGQAVATPVEAELPSPTLATGGGRVCLAPDAGALVFLVPVHRYAAAGLSSEQLCAADEAMVKGTPIGMVSVEGRPRILMDMWTGKIPGNNDTVRQANRVKLLAQIRDLAQKAMPTSDGSDLVSALGLAADLGRSVAQGRTVQLVVTDPGLPDHGAIDYSKPGEFVASADEIANHVKSAGQCPRVSETVVSFVGTGYVLAPHPALTNADRARVTEHWAQTVAACGGKAEFVPAGLTGAAPTTAHPHATITPTDYVDFAPNGKLELVGDSPLAFAPDKTTYAHTAEATAYLDGLAAKLAAHPATHVRILGRTANGSTAWPSLVALGKARAEQVKTDLVARRIAADRITTDGLGYTANPPQVDPATAALNRAVIFELSTP